MILVRNLGDNMPPGWTPWMHWQVEYYADDHNRGFPVGLAWVTAWHPSAEDQLPEQVRGREGAGFTPMLDGVLVWDDERRRGIGAALIRACQERWPGIDLGAASSDAGYALLARFRRSSPLPPLHHLLAHLAASVVPEDGPRGDSDV